MKRAIQYARDIEDGVLDSSQALYDACVRFNNDLLRDDIYLDETQLKKMFTVVETLLKTADGDNIKLYPFQVFIIVNVFGWHYINKRRRISEACLFMPRGVGKSFISALLGLIEMMFPNKLDKNSASVTLAASTHKQAGEVFKQAKEICKEADSDLRECFSIPRSKFQHQGILGFEINDSIMSTISSESNSSEGMNPSLFVLDEYHVFTDDKLLSSLQYAGAKREAPMGVVISTAGDKIDGPLHVMIKAYKDQLQAKEVQDSVFVLIYDLDEDDQKDWENCISNGSLFKVNPLYGQKGQDKVTRFYKKSFADLKTSPSKTAEFKTKLLNIFIEHKDKWINKGVINARLASLDLEDYRGWDAWIGIDLAKKNDLTSATVLLVRDDQFRAFNRCWVPQMTADKLRNNLFWVTMLNNNYLEVTEGYSTDYEPMIQWFIELRDEFDINIRMVLYDNYNAEYIVRRLDEESFYYMEHKQNFAAFNGSVGHMETLLHDPSSDFLIDKNPIVSYCFDNVILFRDKNGNSKPDKTDGAKKIDIAISTLEALGGYFYDFAEGNTGDEDEVYTV